MSINTRDIINSALESLEWDYQHNELNSFQSALDSASEYISTEIDNAMTYTSDIIEYWRAEGCPEPEEMGDTISRSISRAVAESLCAEISDWDILESFVASHEATLDNLPEFDASTDDTETAFNALVEYRESL